ncbi:hypothetical protein DSECCO2_552860 [anaerobic digester metagenome]
MEVVERLDHQRERRPDLVAFVGDRELLDVLAEGDLFEVPDDVCLEVAGEFVHRFSHDPDLVLPLDVEPGGEVAVAELFEHQHHLLQRLRDRAAEEDGNHDADRDRGKEDDDDRVPDGIDRSGEVGEFGARDDVPVERFVVGVGIDDVGAVDLVADDPDLVLDHLADEAFVRPVLSLEGRVHEDLSRAVDDEHVTVAADDRVSEARPDDVERLPLLRPDEEDPDDLAAAVFYRLVCRDVTFTEEVPAPVIGLPLAHHDVVDVLSQLGPDRPAAVGPDDVCGDPDGVVVVHLKDRRRPADQRLDLIDDLEVIVDGIRIAVGAHQRQFPVDDLGSAPGIEVLPEDVEVAVHFVAREFVDIVGPSLRIVHLCLKQRLNLVVYHTARTGIRYHAEHKRRNDR